MVSPEPVSPEPRAELGMVSPEPPELGMVSPEPPGTRAELGMVSPEPRNPGMVSPEPGAELGMVSPEPKVWCPRNPGMVSPEPRNPAELGMVSPEPRYGVPGTPGGIRYGVPGPRNPVPGTRNPGTQLWCPRNPGCAPHRQADFRPMPLDPLRSNDPRSPIPSASMSRRDEKTSHSEISRSPLSPNEANRHRLPIKMGTSANNERRTKRFAAAGFMNNKATKSIRARKELVIKIHNPIIIALVG